MHVDYAKEVYYKLKNPTNVESFTDLNILAILMNDEFVDLGERVGDEKIESICKHMKQSAGYRVNSCFIKKKMTSKQKYCVAKFLLEKYGSIKKVISEAFNVSESDI